MKQQRIVLKSIHRSIVAGWQHQRSLCGRANRNSFRKCAWKHGTSTVACNTSVLSRDQLRLSFYVPVPYYSAKSRRFLGKVSHGCWRCYSKIIISEVPGRSEISSRLPQGFENNLHVLVPATSEKGPLSLRPQHGEFVSMIWQGSWDDPFTLWLNCRHPYWLHYLYYIPHVLKPHDYHPYEIKKA